MTDDPDNSDFEYMAHCRGNTQKDMFYVGAYLGYVENNKLRSLSGKTVTVSQPIGTFITYARTNSPASDGNGGSGYDLWSWYQLIFIQCMYTLKYKNLNSQEVIGKGTISTVQNTGGTETKGMDWGDTVNNNQHVKLFGIEDLWGNKWQWTGGIWYDSNRKIWTATENFNNSGSGYTDRGASGNTSDWGWSYSTKIVGTTHGGFLSLSTSGGSSTTYYCDGSQSTNSRPLMFGGEVGNGDTCGMFQVDFRESNTASGSWGGSRLMYV